ncbi:MAG: AMP-binding protein [Burkholderiales bacterium]|nr:AMP-binding protein [Burkholderiales bacterium]
MAIPSLRSILARWMLRRLRTARDVAHLAYRLHGRKTALIDRRGRFTYACLQDRVLRLHAWMQAQGVHKGDIVFTWLPETGEQYETRLATYENGAIFASFHKHLPALAVLDMLERLRPAVFIHDPQLSRTILPVVRERWPAMHLLALGMAYESALSAHQPQRGREPVHEDDVFALHMTSGTTGLPKSIGYTHRKYLDSVRLISQSIDFSRPKGTVQDVNMLGMPLTGPGSGLVLPTLLSGSALLMPENFHAETLARLIARHRVTRAFLSPSAIIDLLDDPELARHDLSSLYHVPYGSEMMPAAKIAEAVRRFGPIFQQGYGCLEALPPITWLLPHEHVDAAGAPVALDILASAGRVVDGVEVVIRDDNFQPLPAGQTGLITARTPVAFEGYWKDPERTAETLREGWVVMGDVGYFDRHGYLHVLGRTADRVQRAGQWINPREVEEVAHRHPAVKETCLVQHGFQAVLVFSPRHGRCDALSSAGARSALEREVFQHMAATLPQAQQPDRVHLVADIPRSFLNKMLRREVRALLDRNAAPTWATAPDKAAA